MPILLLHLSRDGNSDLHRSVNRSDKGMMNERANGSETENRNVNANATVSVNPTEYISSNTSRGPRAASLTKEV